MNREKPLGSRACIGWPTQRLALLGGGVEAVEGNSFGIAVVQNVDRVAVRDAEHDSREVRS